ncbi:MAG TPA: hypothetical protein DF613_00350, partial [Lachnospiraceae bacterium]|nr:hypothetical protein [Lachnospiraceae bacterium]
MNTGEMNSSDSGCHIQNPAYSFLSANSLLLYYNRLAVFFNCFSKSFLYFIKKIVKIFTSAEY